MRWPRLAILILAGGAVWLNWHVFANPNRLGGLADFPHTYLGAAQVTGDPDDLVIWIGHFERAPANLPQADGLAWPAYWHPDPAVVPPDAQGRPQLFPVLLAPDGRPRTPPLPGHPHGLGAEALSHVQRYHTAEGQALLAAFAHRR